MTSDDWVRQSIAEYYVGDTSFTLKSITEGLTSQTYLFCFADTPYVFQSLHPVFDPAVNLDIDAVTTHIANKGIVTQRLIPARSGEPWITDTDGKVWRVLTFVPGRVPSHMAGPAMARAAGACISIFHKATGDFVYNFQSSSPNIHDLSRHTATLERALREKHNHRFYDRIAPIAEDILRRIAALPLLPEMPFRITHGDLKISNVVFSEDASTAKALIDLDTIGLLPLPIELGDALQSWCGPRSTMQSGISFREDVFEMALHGYVTYMKEQLFDAEVQHIILGTEIVTLELAARFAADALYENYFGWKEDTYPSLSEQNQHLARIQISLAESIQKRRRALERIVASIF